LISGDFGGLFRVRWLLNDEIQNRQSAKTQI